MSEPTEEKCPDGVCPHCGADAAEALAYEWSYGLLVTLLEKHSLEEYTTDADLEDLARRAVRLSRTLMTELAKDEEEAGPAEEVSE